MNYLSVLAWLPVAACCTATAAESHPNVIFILTDDQRFDALSSAGNSQIQTPHLDSLASRGVRFENAFVTLAICSPSRAACLTGRYGSANGVTSVGAVRLNSGERTFAHALKDAGYRTGVTGKWHLKTTPGQCGFDFASVCWANGTWYDRQFTIDGVRKTMPGFVDDVVADESIRFLRESAERDEPFVLWMCTQVPHMDHRHTWPAEQRFLERYAADRMPLPVTWHDDLSGKPPYPASARNRTQALKYGYDDPSAIRGHTRDYYASVQQMDDAVGRFLDELEQLELGTTPGSSSWVTTVGFWENTDLPARSLHTRNRCGYRWRLPVRIETE